MIYGAISFRFISPPHACPSSYCTHVSAIIGRLPCKSALMIIRVLLKYVHVNLQIQCCKNQEPKEETRAVCQWRRFLGQSWKRQL